jgi:hypothetical protein
MGLAVDGCHRRGHGLCGAAVAERQGGPRAPGGALLGWLVTDRGMRTTGIPPAKNPLPMAGHKTQIGV